MTLLIILLAIVVQRYLQFTPSVVQVEWFTHYYHWFVKRFEFMTKGHGLFGLAALVIPILLLVSILFSVVFHMFGLAGYGVLSLSFFWYCTDARDLVKQPYNDVQLPSALLSRVYPKLFGLMFWYALFGPVGLALYYTVYTIHSFVHIKENEASRSIIQMADVVLRVFDWVPVRLFTLSLTLVGNFSDMFSVWLKSIFSGLLPISDLVNPCVQRAATTLSDGINMVNRALVCWLVVIALVTIGMLAG